MSNRTINGHSVNPIGLGCMSLSHAYGTPPSPEDGAKLLHRALDLGYNHLDTARIYGVGKNETLIGETLKGRREEFFLASKCGIVIDGQSRRIDCKPATIHAAIDTSLKLLQTDHIDLYYLHRRDFETPIEESIGALAEAIKAGKIGSIGLSEMSADTLRRANAVHPIAAMQTEYSLWTRNPEIAVLETCKELGTTFVSFSPVSRGALTNSLDTPDALLGSDLRTGLPRFQSENWAANFAHIQAFRAIASELGLTAAQLSLAWVLSQGDHVVAIPGTASLGHLEENIARSDQRLSAEVLARLEKLLQELPVQGPRYSPQLQRSIDTEEFAA